MKCGLCHQEVQKLVKSHIVPLAMLLHGKPDDCPNGMIIVPSNPTSHIKRSPNGVYDRIVCDRCEKSFKAGDDALLAFLRSLDQGIGMVDARGKPVQKTFHNVDTVVLHRGIITTLYRAHLSKHESHHRVQLGAFAEPLRQALLRPASTLDIGFDVILRVIDANEAAVVQCPFKERLFDVTTYRLYFPHMSATIKVDRRPFPAKYREAIMKEHGPLHVVHHDQFALPELRVLSETYARHRSDIDRIMGNG
jgi:hypothetical protein